jgi:hypothetical protein
VSTFSIAQHRRCAERTALSLSIASLHQSFCSTTMVVFARSARRRINVLLLTSICVLIGMGMGLVLYQLAWMFWLPGLLMRHDTESITIMTKNKQDGTYVATTKTVTRRHPDQLFKYDSSGQKVPTYVFLVLCAIG